MCFDLYLNQSYDEKISRYQDLVITLRSHHNHDVKLLVMCFGSLGCVKQDVFGSLRKFTDDKYEIKSVMKWCSISNIIGANYIWRHRVKRVMNL